MPLIQSVERALLLIDLFDEYNTELKLQEISNLLGLNKSTVHSLLMTLQKHRYIEQNKDNKRYRLGLKLFERGNYVIHNISLREAVREYLLSLSWETNHTSHLVILDNNQGLYVDKVEGKSVTVARSRIGRRLPIHSSGAGKVLMAYKKQEELKKILHNYDYKKETNNTITNEAKYLQELEKVKRNGFAIDNEENEPGICCLAVPIKDYTFEVIAAVSLSIPSLELKEEAKKVIPMLKRVGYSISLDLGGG